MKETHSSETAGTTYLTTHNIIQHPRLFTSSLLHNNSHLTIIS